MQVYETINDIARIVGRSRNTVKRWIAHHGFPACKAPNGNYITTSTLIDQWILSRAELSRHRDSHSKAIVRESDHGA